MMSKTPQQHHNDGQADAAEGKVNPPHSHTEEFFSYGEHLKEVHQDNAAYWDGHHNTTNQKSK